MCPVCHKSDGVKVDFKLKAFYHFCLMAKKRVYWRKSVFTTDPDLLPVA